MNSFPDRRRQTRYLHSMAGGTVQNGEISIKKSLYFVITSDKNHGNWVMVCKEMQTMLQLICEWVVATQVLWVNMVSWNKSSSCYQNEGGTICLPCMQTGQLSVWKGMCCLTFLIRRNATQSCNVFMVYYFVGQCANKELQSN